MADSVPVTQEVLNGLTDMVRKHGLSYLGKAMFEFAEAQKLKGPTSDRAASNAVGRVVNRGTDSVSGWMLSFFEMFLAEYGAVVEVKPAPSPLLLKQKVEVTGRGEVVTRPATHLDMTLQDKYEDMREEALRLQAEVKAYKQQVERLKATVSAQLEELHQTDNVGSEVREIAYRVVMGNEVSDSDLLALARLLLKEEVG